jgi:hypothetical protein
MVVTLCGSMRKETISYELNETAVKARANNDLAVRLGAEGAAQLSGFAGYDIQNLMRLDVLKWLGGPAKTIGEMVFRTSAPASDR